MFTLITTYKYSYFAGLQEILVFSFILLATKFSFYISEEKNSNIQNKLIFYCAVGERSALAVQICSSYNLKNVFHLMGGIKSIKNTKKKEKNNNI